MMSKGSAIETSPDDHAFSNMMEHHVIMKEW